MLLAHDLDGPADGQLVVLLHGLSSNRETYRHIVPRLANRVGANRGFRVCNVDLRGHGHSPRGDRYRAGDYAADVADLIETLGIGPAIVIGHSLGGLTASALAQRSPELVLAIFMEDPPLYEGDADVRAASPAASFFPVFLAQATRWQEAGSSEAEVANSLGAQPSPHGGTALERLGPEAMAARARAVLQFDPATMQAAINGDTWIDYDPSTPTPCPVMVVRADPSVGAVFSSDDETSFLRTNPHAIVTLMSGQSHGIHDDPDGQAQYSTALDGFLERRRGDDERGTDNR